VLILAFAILLELTPANVPQGQVARVKASSDAVSVRFNGTTIPLFSQTDGSRHGLVPVPALAPPGRKKIEFLDSTGRVLETASLSVLDARFPTQNVTLGRSLTQLKPAPGEMETVTALRTTVSPVRYWTEPFVAPTAGCLTSPFGVRRMHNGKPTGSYHGGLDQRGAEGVPVRAISDGVVRIVRKFNIHGDTVGIDHGNGVVSFYLHLSNFATSEGALVKKGDLIGSIGSTGRSTAPHLHWALNVHGIPVNPLQWMALQKCGPKPAAKKRRAGKR
jgi:murein DD-endopeptidase MepM/ murein hydrolase activator NlpD